MRNFSAFPGAILLAWNTNKGGATIRACMRNNAFHRVNLGVIGSGKNHEVFDSVVRFVSIFMVNLFVLLKFSTNVFFHNQPVLTSCFCCSVSIGVPYSTFPFWVACSSKGGRLPQAFAFHGAKSGVKYSNSMRRHPNILSAGFAVDVLTPSGCLMADTSTTQCRSHSKGVRFRTDFLPAVANATPASSFSVPSKALNGSESSKLLTGYIFDLSHPESKHGSI